MGQYVVRRLLQAIPLLFLISMGLFALLLMTPGGPLVGQGRSRQLGSKRAEMLKRQFGLDRPLPVQYIAWLIGNDWMPVDADGDGAVDSYGTARGILRGDFGDSFSYRRPVIEVIGERLPNTVYLMGVTFLVVLVVAIPIGIISAAKQYSALDITLTTLSFAGQAVPEFWLGLILVLIFYGWLNILPYGGMKSGATYALSDWKYLVMPVATGALGWIAWYSRFLRSSMLDVIHQDYVRTARAKGLREGVVLARHALRNALIPLVTVVTLDLPYLFAGAVFTEMIFSWPGMGRLYYDAANARDYPLLMAILTIASVIMIFCNLLADVLYALLDPRIHYG